MLEVIGWMILGGIVTYLGLMLWIGKNIKW